MSFLFPKAPPPPPPPPAAPQLADRSIAEAGANEKRSLASADGEGFSGTDVTGGRGSAAPATTKTLLGG